MVADPFASVVGNARGTSPNSELTAAEPDADAAGKVYPYAHALAGGDFESTLELLLDHRGRLDAPLLDRLSDALLAAVHRELSAAMDDGALKQFCQLASVPSTGVLDDPRLTDALERTWARVAKSKVQAPAGAMKKLLEAWRSELTDIVVDRVFSDRFALQECLGDITLPNGDRLWQSLPVGTPALTELIDRAEFRSLLVPHRPTFKYEKGRVRVRASFRSVARLHENLWPMAFAALAGHAAAIR